MLGEGRNWERTGIYGATRATRHFEKHSARAPSLTQYCARRPAQCTSAKDEVGSEVRWLILEDTWLVMKSQSFFCATKMLILGAALFSVREFFRCCAMSEFNSLSP